MIYLNNNHIQDSTLIKFALKKANFDTLFISYSIGIWLNVYLPGDDSSSLAIEGFSEGDSIKGEYYINNRIYKKYLGLWESGDQPRIDIFLTNDDITGVDDYLKIPNEFKLQQNFPNPFNPTTIIKYQIAKRTRVTITVYNTIGQVVKILVDQPKEEGMYETEWDATNLSGNKVASGVYFYKIKAGDFITTKKMVFTK